MICAAKQYKILKIKTPNVRVDAEIFRVAISRKSLLQNGFPEFESLFLMSRQGIDVAAKVEIYNLMNELKKKICVMFVFFGNAGNPGIADRIIVMCDGRITGELMTAEATQNSIMKMATQFEKKNWDSRIRRKKMDKKAGAWKRFMAIRGMGSAVTAFVGLIVIYVAFGIINPTVFSGKILEIFQIHVKSTCLSESVRALS